MWPTAITQEDPAKRLMGKKEFKKIWHTFLLFLAFSYHDALLKIRQNWTICVNLSMCVGEL